MNDRKDHRKATLAKIHIAKKQLAMDDDTYRQILKAVTGQASCSTLALNELFKVLKHMENCGFKVQAPKGKSQNRRRSLARGGYSPVSNGQPIDVIRALWIQMEQDGMVRDGSEQALQVWVKRVTSQKNGGVGVDSLAWLARDDVMTAQVINAIKGWRKRIILQRERQQQPTKDEA